MFYCFKSTVNGPNPRLYPSSYIKRSIYYRIKNVQNSKTFIVGNCAAKTNNILSRLTCRIVILLWHKFICDKSMSGMLINPPIVFTSMRQRWSSTTFSSYLALLVCRSNTVYAIYLIHLLSSCNSGDPDVMDFSSKVTGCKIGSNVS